MRSLPANEGQQLGQVQRAGLLADGPLRATFGCGEANEPCAVFVTWQVQFAALVAQIVLLRWLIARRFQSGA